MHQHARLPFAASSALQRAEGAGAARAADRPDPAARRRRDKRAATGPGPERVQPDAAGASRPAAAHRRWGRGRRRPGRARGRRTADADPMRVIEILSHELRSPITTIHLGTKVLREQGHRISQPVRIEVVEAVEEEAERLYRLVEDLLAVARHEGGAAPLAGRPDRAPALALDRHRRGGPGLPQPPRPRCRSRPTCRRSSQTTRRSPTCAQPARERDPLCAGRDAGRDRGLAERRRHDPAGGARPRVRASRPTRPTPCSSRSTAHRRPWRSGPGRASGSPRPSG